MTEQGSVFGDQARSVDLLWGVDWRPSRGPKPGLSADRIAQAAVRIADTDGLPAVSMQRVASEFGFTTMSLYRYIPGKAELIDLMIDTAVGAPPDLDGLSGWRPRLEAWARHAWAVYHQHPWVLGATATVRLAGPNEMAWLERGVGALSGTGLTGAESIAAAVAILGYVRTMARYSVGDPGGQGMTTEQFGRAFAELLYRHGDRYPALMAAMSAPPADRPDGDGLEFGLRCLLDGLAMRIADK